MVPGEMWLDTSTKPPRLREWVGQEKKPRRVAKKRVLENGISPRCIEGQFEYCIGKLRGEPGFGPMCTAEKNAFLSMMNSIFVYPPAKRPTAAQILESSWMKYWAIPDAERTWSEAR